MPIRFDFQGAGQDPTANMLANLGSNLFRAAPAFERYSLNRQRQRLAREQRGATLNAHQRLGDMLNRRTSQGLSEEYAAEAQELWAAYGSMDHDSLGADESKVMLSQTLDAVGELHAQQGRDQLQSRIRSNLDVGAYQTRGAGGEMEPISELHSQQLQDIEQQLQMPGSDPQALGQAEQQIRQQIAESQRRRYASDALMMKMQATLEDPNLDEGVRAQLMSDRAMFEQRIAAGADESAQELIAGWNYAVAEANRDYSHRQLSDGMKQYLEFRDQASREAQRTGGDVEEIMGRMQQQAQQMGLETLEGIVFDGAEEPSLDGADGGAEPQYEPTRGWKGLGSEGLKRVSAVMEQRVHDAVVAGQHPGSVADAVLRELGLPLTPEAAPESIWRAAARGAQKAQQEMERLEQRERAKSSDRTGRPDSYGRYQ